MLSLSYAASAPPDHEARSHQVLTFVVGAQITAPGAALGPVPVDLLPVAQWSSVHG